MDLLRHWHVHTCPEHGHQVGRGDDGGWLCREGHRVPLPTAVDVVPARLHRGAVEALERIAAIDYREHGMTPAAFRLNNAVAIAMAALATVRVVKCRPVHLRLVEPDMREQEQRARLALYPPARHVRVVPKPDRHPKPSPPSRPAA